MSVKLRAHGRHFKLPSRYFIPVLRICCVVAARSLQLLRLHHLELDLREGRGPWPWTYFCGAQLAVAHSQSQSSLFAPMHMLTALVKSRT
jgi:hypothetical protein